MSVMVSFLEPYWCLMYMRYYIMMLLIVVDGRGLNIF